MTTTSHPNPDRLDQLMVDAATQGLAPQEQAELSAALDQNPGLRFEADAYELAATAVELALHQPVVSESLPATLRQQLVALATTHAAHPQAEEPAAGPPLKLTASTAATVPVVSKGHRAQPSAFSWTDGRAFGWYAAAAALIALAAVLTQAPTPGPTDTASSPTIAEQYESLADRPETIVADWGFNADGGDERFANATGKVIWNTAEQTGYMKLAGMPVNDPTQEQYQLWIVDATRSNQETTDRIDGGVFDVTDTGEVIIPINAKILARKPAVFALTVEKPGGVVVSKGPLQVVAAVDAG